jgi:hypothetical protein
MDKGLAEPAIAPKGLDGEGTRTLRDERAVDPPAVGVARADRRWAPFRGRTDLPPRRACGEVARRRHLPCDSGSDPPIPADDTAWYTATSRAQDIGKWNEVLQAAIERLSRHDTRETPWFPDWMLAITQEMQRFPGMGWPLPRAALEGPLVIERRFGLRGLSWFLEDGWRWPPDADDVLDLMARSDPDQRTRGWATDLLELSQSPGRVTTP